MRDSFPFAHPICPSCLSWGVRTTRGGPDSLGSAEGRTQTSPGFDAAFAFLSAWFVAGLYYDGWAHRNRPSDERFLAPWHEFFVIAGFCLAVFFLAQILRTRHAGMKGARLIPAGYEWSAWGFGLTAVGIVWDLVWHSFFGTEQEFEALFSPPHLAMSIGVGLVVTGPLRSNWRISPNLVDGQRGVALVLGATSALSVVTFATQFANPWIVTHTVSQTFSTPVETQLATALGLAGLLLHSLIWSAFVLLLLRTALPPWGLTAAFGLNAVAVSFLGEGLAWAALGAGTGLVGDLLRAFLRKPSQDRLRSPILAAAVPMVYAALYFGYVQWTSGVAWSPSLWGGIVVSLGALGATLSLLSLRIPLSSEAPAASKRTG